MMFWGEQREVRLNLPLLIALGASSLEIKMDHPGTLEDISVRLPLMV